MKELKEVPRLSPAEVAKRKEKAGELIAQDRQKLLMKMPFIGGMMMRLDIVPVYDERLATAATDGDRIYCISCADSRAIRSCSMSRRISRSISS